MTTKRLRETSAPKLLRARAVVASELLRCAYLERTSAHVMLGLLPAIADLEVKLVLGLQAHKAMVRAQRLERWLACPGVHGVASTAVPAAWRDRMMTLDASGDVPVVVRELTVTLKHELVAACRAAIAGCDALLDAALLQIALPALAELAGELAWSTALVPSADLVASRRTAAAIVDSPSETVPRAKWLWRPLRRERLARRPAQLATHDVAGAAVVPSVAPGKRSAALMLHNNIDAEISTMELYGRCSYEHPFLPEDFHRDVARQAADEARHARACIDAAARHGAPLGTWPVSTDMYDFHYQFTPCKPGSRRELAWRLLLRSTLQEALSIDSFVPLSARLGHDGQKTAARVLEAITADEVFHVEAGVKWTRYLCGGDAGARAEREAAHRYYLACAVRARKQYVKQHPETAIAETRSAKQVATRARARYPFDLGVYLAEDTRKAIGFTEADLEQIARWGYARREATRRQP
jgi:uncharacterized ferritin-like protein (DUF455 family)